MFNGTFSRLDPHRLVALVSCLVQVEPSKEEPKLAAELKGPLQDMRVGGVDRGWRASGMGGWVQFVYVRAWGREGGGGLRPGSTGTAGASVECHLPASQLVW
jgi:hypothetical protein